MPEISVIIPALNEGRYIRHALEGLQIQTFKDFEAIVVDGGSADDTTDIASEYATVITERGRGVSRARNSGAETAKGRIILFLDADTAPSKNLLKSYHDAFKNSRVVAATGPIFPLERSGIRMVMGYAFVSILFVRLAMLLGKPSIVGSNFAVRADAFRKAGGFDNSLITYEDWDLSERIKRLGKIRYVNRAIVHTSVRRIKEWGMYEFAKYYIDNIVQYNLFKRAKEDYSPIR